MMKMIGNLKAAIQVGKILRSSVVNSASHRSPLLLLILNDLEVQFYVNHNHGNQPMPFLKLRY